jgi:hypothetical protein
MREEAIALRGCSLCQLSRAWRRRRAAAKSPTDSQPRPAHEDAVLDETEQPPDDPDPPLSPSLLLLFCVAALVNAGPGKQ